MGFAVCGFLLGKKPYGFTGPLAGLADWSPISECESIR
jgi:hypothetical protein